MPLLPVCEEPLCGTRADTSPAAKAETLQATTQKWSTATTIRLEMIQQLAHLSYIVYCGVADDAGEHRLGAPPLRPGETAIPQI
jgi:hypothetical protein